MWSTQCRKDFEGSAPHDRMDDGERNVQEKTEEEKQAEIGKDSEFAKAVGKASANLRDNVMEGKLFCT